MIIHKQQRWCVRLDMIREDLEIFDEFEVEHLFKEMDMILFHNQLRGFEEHLDNMSDDGSYVTRNHHDLSYVLS